MRHQKEVLIQDLSNKIELDRFLNYRVYRRGPTFGSPLYFAPYFTRSTGLEEGEGIHYLSRVLGVLTLQSHDLDGYAQDIEKMADGRERSEQIKQWKQGISLNPSEERHTFYLLGEPLRLQSPLLKAHHDSVGWIARNIPKNRCVSFQEFAKRMIESTQPTLT